MARIDPLPKDQSDEPARAAAEHLPTLARQPGALQGVASVRRLSADRGNAVGRATASCSILRTALNCGSPYEWGQHVRISLAAGIDRETIDRVADGPGR